MRKRILITGGAGFIGANAANYFLKKGYCVTIADNFSRPGSRINARWLRGNHSDKVLKIIPADISRDLLVLLGLVRDADIILHMAAQVAVTTSVENPVLDFEANCRGALNVMEAVRFSGRKPIIIYTSTNKVYGNLEDVSIKEMAKRYCFSNKPFGIDEAQNLDFHSPYGCSKGAADQYVRDYARIYSIPTIVFRMSCIYGERQFGTVDQGWVAWFITSSLLNQLLTIYGNGKQVRDILYVKRSFKGHGAGYKTYRSYRRADL